MALVNRQGSYGVLANTLFNIMVPMKYNLVRSLILGILVVIFVDSLVVIGVVVAVNVMVLAWFWMKPGNVVPALDCPGKFEVQDEHRIMRNREFHRHSPAPQKVLGRLFG